MAYHLKVQWDWVPLDDWQPLCCKKMPHQCSPCARVAANLRASKTYHFPIFSKAQDFACFPYVHAMTLVWLNPAVRLHRIARRPSVISQQWKGGHWKESDFRLYPSFSFSFCAFLHFDKPSCKSRNCSENNVGRLFHLLLLIVLGLACRHPLLAGRLPSRCHTCKVFPFACFRLETTLSSSLCGISN